MSRLSANLGFPNSFVGIKANAFDMIHPSDDLQKLLISGFSLPARQDTLVYPFR